MSIKSVRIYDLMFGRIISMNFLQGFTFMISAVSRYEGGMVSRAAEKSNMENAVPRQVLKIIIDNTG